MGFGSGPTVSGLSAQLLVHWFPSREAAPASGNSKQRGDELNRPWRGGSSLIPRDGPTRSHSSQLQAGSVRLLVRCLFCGLIVWVHPSAAMPPKLRERWDQDVISLLGPISNQWGEQEELKLRVSRFHMGKLGILLISFNLFLFSPCLSFFQYSNDSLITGIK